VAQHQINTRPYELYISLDDIKALWQAETNWPNEPVLRAGLAALELSFLLIREAAHDPRPHARQAERVKRLVAGCQQQIMLLGDLLTPQPPPESCWFGRPSIHTNLQSLATVDCSYERVLAPLATVFDAWLQTLPFDIGSETHLTALSADREASTPATLKPIIPYDRWVQPAFLAAIFARRSSNPEDRFFAAIHQISECWLFLARRELDASQAAAHARQWFVATRHIHKICAILSYLSEHVLLLETMILADYHPLRVRLRDASGAQSMQVYELVMQAKTMLDPVHAYQEVNGGNLLDIYRMPNQYAGVYEYLTALGSLEIKLTDFFFHHYKLATQVLGAESLGSLGFEVRNLTKRFVEPFYPALDQVRYQHMIATNFAYGRYAGLLITECEALEAAPKMHIVPEAVSAAIMEARSNRYIQAICDRDVEAWTSLFTADGIIEDPRGSRPFYGHNGLRVFFNNLMKAFTSDIVMRANQAIFAPHCGRAKIAWQLSALHKNVPIHFSGTEEIWFAANGQIKYVHVVQDPSVVAKQLLAHWSVV
jgi:tryptophan 2,3-dioxygenase